MPVQLLLATVWIQLFPMHLESHTDLNPSTVRTSAHDRVFFQDYPSGKTLVFAAGGKLVKEVGGLGEGPGENQFVSFLHETGDGYLVATGGRVHSYDRDLTLIETKRTVAGYLTAIAGEKLIFNSGPYAFGFGGTLMVYDWVTKDKVRFAKPSAQTRDNGLAANQVSFLVPGGEPLIVWADGLDLGDVRLYGLDGEPRGRFSPELAGLRQGGPLKAKSYEAVRAYVNRIDIPWQFGSFGFEHEGQSYALLTYRSDGLMGERFIVQIFALGHEHPVHPVHVEIFEGFRHPVLFHEGRLILFEKLGWYDGRYHHRLAPVDVPL